MDNSIQNVVVLIAIPRSTCFFDKQVYEQLKVMYHLLCLIYELQLSVTLEPASGELSESINLTNYGNCNIVLSSCVLN